MAGWKQLFKELNNIKKEATGALDKFNAAQKYLMNVGNGKPDADELRDALVGSPLKNEIKKLKKLQRSVNKVVRPRVKFEEDLPDITMKSALQRITKKPWPEEALYEAERIQLDCDIAVTRLSQRSLETTKFILKVIFAEVKAKQAKASSRRLTSVMKTCMRIPRVSSVCGPIWLDLELSITPIVGDLSAKFTAMNKNYNKLNAKLIKRMGEYAQISKSVQNVIDEASKIVYK